MEFSKRKEQDANTSAESGYSDGPASEDEEENLPRPSTPKYETKRKGNKEKFLLKVDSNGKKTLRIHSVSPIRCAKALNLLRRNSETQITQFATETIEAATATVKPVEQYTIEKIEHVPFNIEDIVRLGSPAQKLTRKTDNDRIKITEPIVRGSPSSPKPGPSNAKKLIDSKCSGGARPKMCFELRKKNATKLSEPKAEESLEDMFMRLSGQPGSSSSDESTDMCSSITQQQDSANVDSQVRTDDERRAERAARIQKLEEQCKSLIAKVMRTSNRNDELSRQIDKVQNRHTSARETPPRVVLDNKAESNIDEPTESKVEEVECAIAAVVSEQPKKTDEECLSAREVEYTSRRSDRLKRLEDEYKQFLSKMNKTKEKANDVTKKLDNLHERFKSTSSEEQVESTDEEKTSVASPEGDLVNCDVDASVPGSSNENKVVIEELPVSISTTSSSETSTPTCSTASTSASSAPDFDEKDMARLTPRELEYVSKRNERLKRLEEESKAFLDRLQKRNERVTTFNNRLDNLQNRSENDTPPTESVLNDNSNAEVHLETSSDLPEESQDSSTNNIVRDSEQNFNANEDDQVHSTNNDGGERNN